MTRIIAGTARGRRLKVPAQLTRPTSDRVREALFSSLESMRGMSGARVLDLFAGSGGLGLEALSRGAAEVVLVDNSAQAARVIAENIQTVGMAGAHLERRSARDYLTGPPRPFDIVLMDPPYSLSDDEVAVLVRALTGGWLSSQAIVVIERGSPGVADLWPVGFGASWNRRFGGTHVARAVWYGHEQVPSPHP
ncbi:MAG: 16S rRNA (guanine(966)-N(2))-methyltransferase RsmD [Candidatus Nanopelagicales bacterium]|nr:16S rRNA (guanine(966)-N(2))-methyltransferase RsmD [Candidatus Nanopelagicales bacterium]MCU0295215.1 16S rRNA (guanine(966)-N(2))-methyltransferase RsmD [Candidatus Nanopelagicales bacterium]